ncbi:MAG: exodeoxyribonuclease VII large subunit [Candidatus Omnitrophota bacterium]|nr:exodeoxyribonuclease VII large subunit [Candidatus Omnitrophota bacterium]
MSPRGAARLVAEPTVGEPVSAARWQADGEPTYSVSEVNELVRGVLREQFPRPIWVRGELRGYDLRKDRRWVSFTLAEKHPEADDLLATVTAVLFPEDRQVIEGVLRRAENAFHLQDGIEVRFLVDVDLWAKAGRYQLRVRGIDSTYTLGRLAQQRKRVLELLTQRGLLERNKGCVVPLVPLRIGLIAAQGSAGFTDFVTHLVQSRFAFVVRHLESAMQGPQVEPDVVRALQRFNRALDVDVIVITRGGGSATDLSAFDRLGLAEAIATSRLPVLTGLGHAHDTSVADLVAYESLKTPTDVAQFLIDRVEAFVGLLEEAARHLGERAVELLQAGTEGLLEAAREISTAAQALVSTAAGWLVDQRWDLVRRSEGMASAHRQYLRGCAQRLTPDRLQQLVSQEQVGLTNRAMTLQRDVQHVLATARLRLAAAGEQVAMLDPAKTLRRGFSITRDANGRLISTISRVSLEDVLVTQVSDGALQSRVEVVTPEHEEGSRG